MPLRGMRENHQLPEVNYVEAIHNTEQRLDVNSES